MSELCRVLRPDNFFKKNVSFLVTNQQETGFSAGRINLSSFTKDFRIEEQVYGYDSVLQVFLHY